MDDVGPMMICGMSNMKNYMKTFVKISHKVTSSVGIDSFELSQKEFAKLFVTFKHWEMFRLTKSKFFPDKQFKFGQSLARSKYQRIVLSQVGHWRFSCWGQDPSVFENIIQGFSQEPSLVENLVWMRLFHSNLKKEFVTEVLAKYGFDKVFVQAV